MFTERKECPVCASADFDEIYSAALSLPPISDYLNRIYSRVGPGINLDLLLDTHYQLLHCNQCTLYFQKHIPNDELMLILYEEWIDPETTRLNHLESDDVNRFNYYASEIATLLAILDKVPSTVNVLDFGMGWGKWALMAKAFGMQASGAELSPARIKNARNIGINITSWEEIPNANFDFINTEQVFEHLPDPVEMLAHLKTGLSPEGLLKISVPTDNNIAKKLSKMNWSAKRFGADDLNAVSPLEHINLYNRKSLTKLANRADMEIVNIPMSTQLRFSSNWKNPKAIARNFALPIYRNWLKKQNYVFLKAK